MAGENPTGKLSNPFIPAMSSVPTFENTMVNGTFLSPDCTSIFPKDVPKYASRNFISVNPCSNVDTPGVICSGAL